MSIHQRYDQGFQVARFKRGAQKTGCTVKWLNYLCETCYAKMNPKNFAMFRPRPECRGLCLKMRAACSCCTRGRSEYAPWLTSMHIWCLELPFLQKHKAEAPDAKHIPGKTWGPHTQALNRVEHFHMDEWSRLAGRIEPSDLLLLVLLSLQLPWNATIARYHHVTATFRVQITPLYSSSWLPRWRADCQMRYPMTWVRAASQRPFIYEISPLPRL